MKYVSSLVLAVAMLFGQSTALAGNQWVTQTGKIDDPVRDTDISVPNNSWRNPQYIKAGDGNYKVVVTHSPGSAFAVFLFKRNSEGFLDKVASFVPKTIAEAKQTKVLTYKGKKGHYIIVIDSMFSNKDDPYFPNKTPSYKLMYKFPNSSVVKFKNQPFN